MYFIIDKKTYWIYHTSDNYELAIAYVNCNNLKLDDVILLEFETNNEIGGRYIGKLWNAIKREFDKDENK